jgi:[ribosomal protein S18]-alanine N-acetyltransferase
VSPDPRPGRAQEGPGLNPDPRPVRWWDVPELVALERRLFGDDAWSEATWWGELAQVPAAARPPSSGRPSPLVHGDVASGGPEATPVHGSARGRRYLVDRDPASGAVRGYAGVALNGPDADVMTVAVAPEEQGHGLGRRLTEALVDVAADEGASQLLLEVRADNALAQRLYARLGFERIAVRRGYYAGGVDAWIMRRRPLRPAAGPDVAAR